MAKRQEPNLLHTNPVLVEKFSSQQRGALIGAGALIGHDSEACMNGEPCAGT